MCWQHHQSFVLAIFLLFILDRCYKQMCWRIVLLFAHSVVHIFLYLIKSKTGICLLSLEECP
jgi:hypothetical protein